MFLTNGDTLDMMDKNRRLTQNMEDVDTHYDYNEFMKYINAPRKVITASWNKLKVHVKGKGEREIVRKLTNQTRKGFKHVLWKEALEQSYVGQWFDGSLNTFFVYKVMDNYYRLSGHRDIYDKI